MDLDPDLDTSIAIFTVDMSWRPEQEPVNELAQYLKDALNAHDQKAQRYATMVGLPICSINHIQGYDLAVASFI